MFGYLNDSVSMLPTAEEDILLVTLYMCLQDASSPVVRALNNYPMNMESRSYVHTY